MRANRYNDKAFISKINELLKRDGEGPYGWRSVSPWRKGICVPRTAVVVAIDEFTKGEVTYRDHVETVREAGFRTRHHPPAFNGAA